MLLNEGGGEVFEYEGRRRYGVCCAEKGIFRFKLTATGAAGHASLPKTGDNALLKLGPVLPKLADIEASFEVTEAPAALLRGLGEDPADPAAALARDRRARARAARVRRADARRDADADDGARIGQDQRDPVAGIAEGRLPGPTRARRGGCAPADRARCSATTPSSFEIEFTETVTGNASRGADAADGRDRQLGQGQRPGRRDGAGDPPGVLGLALVPRGVSRLRRLRLLPAAPHEPARGRRRSSTTPTSGSTCAT